MDLKHYERQFEPIILGNWNSFKGAEELETLLQNLTKSSDHPIHLALPYTLALEYCENKSKQPEIEIGSNAMHSVSKGEYTEEIALKMLAQKNIPFVLFDIKETALTSQNPIKEVNEKIKALLEGGIRVFVALTESYAEFLEGTSANRITANIGTLLDGVATNHLQNITFVYTSPSVSLTAVKKLKQGVNDSYSFFRQTLESVLGSDSASKIRVMVAAPFISEDSSSLLLESNCDGFYFSNIAVYPTPFLQTCEGFNNTTQTTPPPV